MAHGAPLTLRLERQIGYKGMKFLTELIVTEQFDDGSDCGYPKNGWAWYNGISLRQRQRGQERVDRPGHRAPHEISGGRWPNSQTPTSRDGVDSSGS